MVVVTAGEKVEEDAADDDDTTRLPMALPLAPKSLPRSELLLLAEYGSAVDAFDAEERSVSSEDDATESLSASFVAAASAVAVRPPER